MAKVQAAWDAQWAEVFSADWSSKSEGRGYRAESRAAGIEMQSCGDPPVVLVRHYFAG